VTGSLRADGARVVVQPADVTGRYATARKLVFTLLIGIYLALPFVPVGGHPAVFIDIPDRRFYVFGAVLDARDLWMMTFVLLGAGLTLLYVTALFGRLWCGWACPQTVFLEGVYRRVERWLQGSREQRIRRDAGPWTWGKLARKGTTHAAWLVISAGLAHVFLSYFTSMPALVQMVAGSPGAHPEAFAVATVVTAAVYFNFAWFREQTCVVVCPYGRLQSALIDADSLVVGYDARRGEPRGKVATEGAGACVDCRRCVVVCPTAIDIRDGLQMDCIGCTACIDACDEIMDKLHRPRGLIRYDSQRGLAGEKTRIIRPRMIAYTLLLGVVLLVSTLILGGRASFDVSLLRPPGVPYSLVDGEVRNAFDLHVVNKRHEATTFTLVPTPAEGVRFEVPVRELVLLPQEDRHVPVLARMARERFHGDFAVTIQVNAAGEDGRGLSARFLGPSP
jgi:cytochrome c oxidase accessory protein FixG